MAKTKITDQKILSQARTYYEKGQLDKAITTYSKIKPDSDFWLESIEERAWAHTRKGDFEKALGDLHSITSPVLAPQVGPETYMLSTFVSLKICAYKDVVKKIALFKKVLLPRVDYLQNIVDKTMTDEIWSSLKELNSKKINLIGLGKLAEKMPRYYFRDKILLEATKLNEKQKAYSRLQVLAQHDLNEIETNLKKMKLMDVEVMQKVLTMEKNLSKETKKLKFSSPDPDKTMIFPITDEELWIDEVGHYEVKSNLCQKKTGGTTL